jgi:autotransporter-associated beta strand protein
VLNDSNAIQDLTLGSAGSGDYTGVITGARSIRKVGAGTQTYDPGTLTTSLVGLNVSGGTLELNSGNFTVTGGASPSQPDSISGFIVSRGGTFRMNGANVTATGGSYVITAGNTGGGGNNFILESGTFDGGNREVLNSFGGSGTFTINDGLFIGGEFRISQSATGTVNLNGGTLRVTNLKYSNADAIVNFDGGTLQAKANRADFITSSVTDVKIRAGGAVIDSNGFNITIPKIMTEDSGSTGGGLTKIGSGSLTLTANNSYTGPTNVQVGSLLVNGDHTLATGPANVDANAGLGGDGIIGAASYDDGARFPWTVADWTAAPNLSAGAVTIDGALTVVVDDSLSAAPVANFTDATTTFTILSASSLTVTNPSLLAVDSTGFTSGSGTWTVQKNGNTLELVYTAAAASPFTTWATTNGLAGDDALPGADPDNDGLDNLIEFVIGGQPNPANPNSNSNGLVPVTALDATHLVFTYRRTALSATQPGLSVAAEYGSNLSGWTTALNGVSGVVITTTPDGFGAGVDRVDVSMPRTLAPGGKLFARLKVVIP